MTSKWNKRGQQWVGRAEKFLSRWTFFHLNSQTLWKFFIVWRWWWCMKMKYKSMPWHWTGAFTKNRNIDESARLAFLRKNLKSVLHGHLSCATWKITLMFIFVNKKRYSTDSWKHSPPRCGWHKSHNRDISFCQRASWGAKEKLRVTWKVVAFSPRFNFRYSREQRKYHSTMN